MAFLGPGGKRTISSSPNYNKRCVIDLLQSIGSSLKSGESCKLSAKTDHMFSSHRLLQGKVLIRVFPTLTNTPRWIWDNFINKSRKHRLTYHCALASVQPSVFLVSYVKLFQFNA